VRNNNIKKRALVGLAMAGLLACASPAHAQERERLPIEKLRSFTEVYGAVRQTYLESVEHDVLIRNAIEGLLKVDPYAAYLDPEEFRELQAAPRGTVGGIGVEVTQRRGALRVVSAIEGSPAARAGLQPQDALLKIDDVDAQEMRLSEAVKLLRGKPGTAMKLTIQRQGEPTPRELSVVREVVRVQSVKSRLINADVAYVRVAQFQEATPEILARELTRLFKLGEPKVLVLDLRSNPGGLLNSCIAAAALFLPDNTLILKTEGRASEANREYRAVAEDYLRAGQADPRPLLPARARTIPMAVLVDRGTASGSEFVAAALRDNKRAVLAGEQTFGRGAIQTIMPLGNNAAVKLTTARFRSPSGQQFEGIGLRPDVVVPNQLSPADFGSDTDNVLRAALDKLVR
jgi:carboxyl-terminal processing protease